MDGGYVENTGTGTMLEVLKVLKPIFLDASIKTKIVPYVLVIKYGETEEPSKGLKVGNELTEVLMGIYNIRSSRTDIAQNELEVFVNEMGGHYIKITLPLSGKKLPMNWVLSEKALDTLERYIRRKYVGNAFKQLYCLNDTLKVITKSRAVCGNP